LTPREPLPGAQGSTGIDLLRSSKFESLFAKTLVFFRVLLDWSSVISGRFLVVDAVWRVESMRRMRGLRFKDVSLSFARLSLGANRPASAKVRNTTIKNRPTSNLMMRTSD
jgi:hypothetical protein